MKFEDCPICLSEMHQIDFDHPLQCARHCGYNFCKNCIQSLISSSKDDYMEASDGNCHVKVFLTCPNCRSDLSETIRDTLLLRKADAVINASSEEELTESQLLLKSILNTAKVRNAISNARRLEAKALGTELDEVDEIEEFTEEIGVEADLINGVHRSFHLPRPPSPTFCKKKVVKEDPTLFAGLDYFLSQEERLYVTELMSSGETANLAEAAQLLFFVAKDAFSNNNKKASTLERSESCKSRIQNSKRSFVKKSSFLDLIDEAEDAHQGFDKKHSKSTTAGQRREQIQSMARQVQIQNEFPIPVRMPKVIEISFAEKFELQFIDYEWDGTVMDAYSKLSIGFNRKSVRQKRPNNKRVRLVLDGDGDVQVEMPGQKRILVGHVGHSAGKQGTMLGDVVTHVNGISVANKSSTELMDLINESKQKGDAIV
eukprot:CAMPEP_0178916954 /NCGR_PEP_ID=MMETSP0786-20121207/12960_1 /TAXON_ID=186022 /ORGANISM="Thalassionema frauenfeldii, Strain CCMP 1798" /LENGTH=428 /DNA_ID=CAMNT_0020590415 /DNA_START=177 /DNA_END=1460 /DNA_ORIENTATION=-